MKSYRILRRKISQLKKLFFRNRIVKMKYVKLQLADNISFSVTIVKISIKFYLISKLNEIVIPGREKSYFNST
jgi:hypothetical protein